MKNSVKVDLWKNRRAMAWSSLVASLLFPLLVLFAESEQLGAISGAFYMFTTGVVSVYTVSATYDDSKRREQKNDPE